MKRRHSGTIVSGAAPAPNASSIVPFLRTLVFSLKTPWTLESRETDAWRLAEALRTRGFALVEHPEADQLEAMEVSLRRCFALGPTTKQALRRGDEDGFATGPYKEMFHFGPHSNAVQQSKQSHIPKAAQGFRDTAIWMGERLLHCLNDTLLCPGGDDPRAAAWYGSDDEKPCNLREASIVTGFLYHAANPSVWHCSAHVDKGLFTLISNPMDVEVCVDGEWVAPYRYPNRRAKGHVLLVLCGHTLEQASAGVFQASLHRIRNSGPRRSTVVELRGQPSLTVFPAFLTSEVCDTGRVHPWFAGAPSMCV